MFFKNFFNFQQLKFQAVNKRKSFLDSNNVIVSYNHGGFHCFVNSTFNGPCQKLPSPNNLSYVNHYRNKLHRNQNSDTITNTGIWRFKDELMNAVNFTLSSTKFVP